MTAVGAGDLIQGGEALIDARKFEQALALVSQAVAIDPTLARAHGLATRALIGLDRYDEACSASLQAVSLAPRVAYYHRLRAISLTRRARQCQGQARQACLLEATAAGREAVRLGPIDPGNYTVLAEAYAWCGDIKQADGAIQEALMLSPNGADTWASASFVGTRARNWRAAELAARKALAIDPQNYAATNNLGVALRRRGKWTLGAVAFQDAARIDPRSSTARDNVEGIGFQYLDYIVVVALLPLVVVWPLFVAARIGLNRWFSKKPERLRPLAQRLGMRVATSKRQQRKFAKAAERAQKMVSPDFPAGEWSALEHRRFFSFNYDLVAGGLVLGAGLVFLALAFAGSGASSVATLAVVGVFMMGTGAATLWRFSRQRHAA